MNREGAKTLRKKKPERHGDDIKTFAPLRLGGKRAFAPLRLSG